MTDVHPRLVAGFAALDAAGVRWCLLRGRDTLLAPTGGSCTLRMPSEVAVRNTRPGSSSAASKRKRIERG